MGNASHERGTAHVGSLATTARQEGTEWVLDGEKYHSTGALFADWITTTAQTPDGRQVSVSVPAHAHGVDRVDDWDGFGQRLTGSGTTRYTGVRVPATHVQPRPRERHATLLPAFLQTILLATLGRYRPRGGARRRTVRP